MTQHPDIHEKFRGATLAFPAYWCLKSSLKRKYDSDTCFLEILSHNTRAKSLYVKPRFVEFGSISFGARDNHDVDSISIFMRMK